jgi:TonB family protein
VIEIAIVAPRPAPRDRGAQGGGGARIASRTHTPTRAEPSARTPTAEAPSSPAAPEGPPAQPNLFLPGALASVLPSPAPNWGGRSGKPNDRDDEKAIVSARVDKWLQQEGAANFARSGRVAPVWRDVERQIDAAFRPTVDQITRDNVAQSAVKQLLGAKLESGPVERGRDASHELQSDHRGFAASRAEQVEAARRAYETPRNWTRVEIESEIGEDGSLLGLRIVLPSGMRELDQAALEAVKKAVSRRPPRDGHAVARWAVEAAVVSKLPAGGAITDEVSGRTVGGGVGINFTFDESTGKFGVDIPFKRSVHTRISLIAITRP